MKQQEIEAMTTDGSNNVFVAAFESKLRNLAGLDDKERIPEESLKTLESLEDSKTGYYCSAQHTLYYSGK